MDRARGGTIGFAAAPKPEGPLGLGIMLFFVLGRFSPRRSLTIPEENCGRPNQPPSSLHWVGTDGQGRDVLSQLIWGARTRCEMGSLVGILTTIVGAWSA